MQPSKPVNFVPQKLSLYIFLAMSNLTVECFLIGSSSPILPQMLHTYSLLWPTLKRKYRQSGEQIFLHADYILL